MGKGGKFIFGAVLGALATTLLTPVERKKAEKTLRKLARAQGLDTAKLRAVMTKLVAGGSALAGFMDAVRGLPASRRVSRKTKSKT